MNEEIIENNNEWYAPTDDEIIDFDAADEDRNFNKIVVGEVYNRLELYEDEGEFDLSDEKLDERIATAILDYNDDFWDDIYNLIDDYTKKYCDEHNLTLEYFY